MSKHFNTPRNSSKGQDEDKQFFNQLKVVFKAFQQKPSTMLMVSKETGILRANICRYVATMRKHGSICLLNKSTCPVSKYRAGFYSTDKSLFPTYPPQLSLF